MDFHMNNNNEDDKKCLDAHFVQAVFRVLSEPGHPVFLILHMRKLTCRESGPLLISTQRDPLLVKCTESSLFFKLLNACYVSLKQSSIWVTYT